MGLHHSPRIVTNGLVLAIDPADQNSYPGSGTTVTNLTGNADLNGTLQGGTTVDSNNPANTPAFVHDGVNNVINFGIGSDIFPIPQVTFDIAFRSTGTTPTTGTSPGLFGFTYGMRSFVNSTTFIFGLDNGTSATYISYGEGLRDSQWHIATMTNNGSTGIIYMDGVQVASGAQSWSGTTRWPTNSLYIGRDNNNVNYFFTGNIGHFRVYNRVLTASEVLHNYEATRTRYGI